MSAPTKMQEIFDKVPESAIAHASLWHRLLGHFIDSSNRSEPSPRLIPRLHWCRIVPWALLGFSVGYAGTAASALAFVRYGRGVEGVSYFDLLLPHRWPHYKIALGEHQLRLAKESLDNGKRHEALIWARTGLARSPANRDGRLLLAQLYGEGNRPDEARKTLLDGLPFHRDDPRFLEPLFSLLLRHHHDATISTLARSLLTTQPPSPERNRLAALTGATVSFLRGEHDQAEDFLRHFPSLTSSRDGRLLAAKLNYARGHHDFALISLRLLAAEFPHDAEIHHELVQRLCESGARDEARRCTLSFQIAHPELPQLRIALLRDLLESGDTAGVAREIDAFIRDFAADPNALLALADFAVHSADPRLARRLFEHACNQGLPPEPHALLVVEALVTARDHRGALEVADTLSKEFPDFATRFQPLLNSLRGIAYYGLGETESGRLFIGHYLSLPYLRAENLLAVAQRLLAVNAPAIAHDALVRAVAADPLNQAALTRLVELDLELNRTDELPARLLTLVTMRQPSLDLLRVAQHKLGSDLFLFSAEREAALAAVRATLERQTQPRRSRL